MKYCGYKKIETENEEGIIVNCIVPKIDNGRVKINPNPKNDTEYYIILE